MKDIDYIYNELPALTLAQDTLYHETQFHGAIKKKKFYFLR